MNGNMRCSYCALAFSALVVSAMGYLTFTAVQGENGLLRLLQIEAKEEKLQQELAALQIERMAVDNVVRRLSAEELDPDLLDERARAVLALGHPQELIIP